MYYFVNINVWGFKAKIRVVFDNPKLKYFLRKKFKKFGST